MPPSSLIGWMVGGVSDDQPMQAPSMGGGASQPLNLQLEGDNVFSHPGIGNFEEGHKPNHATDLNLI